MEDIPQPQSDPYESGDRVQIYLSDVDVDATHHGTECIIVDRSYDDLGEETGRELDAYSYRLRPVDGAEPLPIEFRHFDLVPAVSE